MGRRGAGMTAIAKKRHSAAFPIGTGLIIVGAPGRRGPSPGILVTLEKNVGDIRVEFEVSAEGSVERSRNASWIAGLLAVVGLGLAGAALEPDGARAQLRDPPLGWDMWDPGWTRREMWQPERMDESLRWRMSRHRAFMQDGVPAAYQGARNPMARTPETIAAGGAIYAEECATCHDPSGTGHGDAGLALYPSPALLAELIRMPQAADEYLLWAISEGGEPFGTQMPAFKEVLSAEQIWQVITYMRAGFPAAGDTEE
jgi:mono/diheme cytochrome c family protein